MERYICIHGHFYQPPRENPWLGEVEIQDSAHPFHDWNERITAECYEPNTSARILDGENQIVGIVSNYSKISFNFGPTLLSWMQRKDPVTYAAILEADRESRTRFSGHGSALAQAFHHIILPLANRRDKRTQVLWGIRDFEHRFGRSPEGLWLPETAACVESLEVLAEYGIRFTVLSPYQAKRIRQIGELPWTDVSGGRIDPTMPYRAILPSGRTIDLFFYDGPIAKAVAFEKLLSSGERFASRLTGGFNDSRNHAQLVHIATDGETYGHHHPHGDMALAYTLHHIEAGNQARLTNYGEYLERHPPTHEVEIFENSSWSCVHGVERWRSNCGCCSGGQPGWNQEWRRPLRAALDLLRDTLNPLFEQEGKALFLDPWTARDQYISLVLDESPAASYAFLRAHLRSPLDPPSAARALKLMELQHQLMLMYTSCGWFFDEVSGLETVQILRYAGRAIELGRSLFGRDVEPQFLDALEKAKSNIAEHRDGREVYKKFVRTSTVSDSQIAAHHALSSLFDPAPGSVTIYKWRIEELAAAAQSHDSTISRLCHIRLASGIAQSEYLTAAIHSPDADPLAFVLPLTAPSKGTAPAIDAAIAAAVNPKELSAFFAEHGAAKFGFDSLLFDKQREIAQKLTAETSAAVETHYREIYAVQKRVMLLLRRTFTPIPYGFRAAAEFVLSADIRHALSADTLDAEALTSAFAEAKLWGVTLDTSLFGHTLRMALEQRVRQFSDALSGADPGELNPADTLSLLTRLYDFAAKALSFSLPVNLFRCQNQFFGLVLDVYPEFRVKAEHGNTAAKEWCSAFANLARVFGVRLNVESRVRELKTALAVRMALGEELAARSLPLSVFRLSSSDSAPRALDRQFSRAAQLGVSHLTVPFPALQQLPDPAAFRGATPKFLAELDLSGFSSLSIFAAAWKSLLQLGPYSPHRGKFAVRWASERGPLDSKILLPVLNTPYGKALDSGFIRLALVDSLPAVCFHPLVLPLCPQSLSAVLFSLVERLSTSDLPPEAAAQCRSLAEGLKSIRVLGDPGSLEEATAAARRLADLTHSLRTFLEAFPAAAELLSALLEQINGKLGISDSYRTLHRLLEDQFYRLTERAASPERANYRRFMGLATLPLLRTSQPEVLAEYLAPLTELLVTKKLDGVVLQNAELSEDPRDLARRLQSTYLSSLVLRRYAENLRAADCSDAAESALSAVAARAAVPRPWPLLAFVSDLSLAELHSSAAPASGTSGSETARILLGLFRPASSTSHLSADGASAMRSLVGRLLADPLAAQLSDIAGQCEDFAARNIYTRDLTAAALGRALTAFLGELLPALAARAPLLIPLQPDATEIEAALTSARPELDPAALSAADLLRSTLLLPASDTAGEALAAGLAIQQQIFSLIRHTLAALHAVMVERDLIIADPSFASRAIQPVPVADFHAFFANRHQTGRQSLLSAASLFLPFGDSLSARCAALDRFPTEVESLASALRELAPQTMEPETARTAVRLAILTFDGSAGHDGKSLHARIAASYHTQLLDGPLSEQLEHACSVLCNHAEAESLRGQLGTTAAEVAGIGERMALSALVLRATLPGIFELFEGSDATDLRSNIWREPPPEADPARVELLRKLCLLRTRLPGCFISGSYQPLEVSGPAAARCCAFRRSYQELQMLVICDITPHDPPASLCFHFPNRPGTGFVEVLTGQRLSLLAGQAPSTVEIPSPFTKLPALVLVPEELSTRFGLLKDAESPPDNVAAN